MTRGVGLKAQLRPWMRPRVLPEGITLGDAHPGDPAEGRYHHIPKEQLHGVGRWVCSLLERQRVSLSVGFVFPFVFNTDPK